MRKIGVLDCNNFFVSCERTVNPSLEGCAVIVSSGNNGCAISRSNEAKAIGIKMGQPLFQAKELIEKHNVTVCVANHKLYGEISRRIMETVAELVPETEVYSIDEVFLNFGGMEHLDLKEYGQKIIKTVREKTGIPVSLGIAGTKTLAKLANRLAKKYPAYKGVCIIETEEQRIKALELTGIRDVWGIGRKYDKKMQNLGVKTAYDFTLLSREVVRKMGTVILERTWSELRGTSCIELETRHADQKSLATTRTFEQMTSDYKVLAEAISGYAASCARRLRRQNSCAVSLTVFIWTNRHRPDLPQYRNSAAITLPVPTNSTIEIMKYAGEGLKKIFKEGFFYKQAGVVITEIVSAAGVQTDMFDTVDRNKQNRLMKTVDAINEKYAGDKIVMGLHGIPKEPKKSKTKKE